MSPHAQLMEMHRDHIALKAECLQLAEALRQRDAALARTLDTVTGALFRGGHMGEGERWQLAAALTEARLLLDGEA